MKDIIIYSTPTCHYCEMAKKFFDEHDIEYTTHDVSTNLIKRKEMIMNSDQMGVPVIKIGDSYIVGFDEEKIRKILDL